MEQKLVSEEVLKHLLSPESTIEDIKIMNEIEQKEQLKQPHPRLTMKLLHELIKELQYENTVLAERVNELKQQLDEFNHFQAAVAATVAAAATTETTEAVIPSPVLEMAVVSQSLPTEIQPITLLPRNIRHPAPRKKSFWNLIILLFRPAFLRRLIK